MNIYSTSHAGHGDPRVYWRRAIHDTFHGMELEYDGDDHDFGGRIVSRKLGELQLSHTTFSNPHRSIRPKRLDQDCLWLCFVLSGSTYISHSGHTAELTQGDFALLDSTRTGSLEFASDFDGLWIRAPRALLERRALVLDKILGCRVDGNAGVGYVASKMLEAVSSQFPTLDEGVANKVCDNLLDMVGTAFGSAMSGSISIPPSRHLEMLQRIQRFIDTHLHEEVLSPAMIAEEHGISVRYLNKLFEQEGLSVSRRIWTQRLERCRTLFEDPLQMHRYVSDIAYSCGFNNVSHFNRTFKAHFGCSPGNYRQRYHAANKTGIAASIA